MNIDILFFAGLYEGRGIGHLIRTSEIVNYLISQYPDLDIVFSSNNLTEAKRIIDLFKIRLEISDLNNIERAKIIFWDSPFEDIEKYNINRKTLIRLDYFNYPNSAVDLVVNLYNHDYNDFSNFEIKSGLRYTVIRNQLLKGKLIKDELSSKNDILITFGGEDRNDNTIKSLESIFSISRLNFNINVIIPPLYKKNEKLNFYLDKINILPPTLNIEQYYIKNSCVITGGGTTLLEAIYYDKKVLAISQNELEHNFIQYLSGCTKIFSLDEINEFIESKHNGHNNLIDGNGKKRITKIIIDELKK